MKHVYFIRHVNIEITVIHDDESQERLFFHINGEFIISLVDMSRKDIGAEKLPALLVSEIGRYGVLIKSWMEPDRPVLIALVMQRPSHILAA